MTHKEFYFWLEGYLHSKNNLSYDELAVFIDTVKDKMKKVKDNDSLFPNPSTIVPHRFEPVPVPSNPFKDDGYDDLGAPPKIVM
jgi:hypothetical protein